MWYYPSFTQNILVHSASQGRRQECFFFFFLIKFLEDTSPFCGNRSVSFITACKRSLGHGNIFTSVRHSFCLRGRVCIQECGQTPPPNEIHGILKDTVNKWAVRILLECILVLYYIILHYIIIVWFLFNSILFL